MKFKKGGNMPVFDINFSRKLAEVATTLINEEPDQLEARRTVIYLSRLSIELSLKALLERAGKPIALIRGHSHNLRSLLAEVDQCEMLVEVTPGQPIWVPASRLRSVDVSFMGHSITLGVVIEAENHGASVYPNEIRYGQNIRDIAPEALAPSAVTLSAWVNENWNSLRSR